MKIWSVTEVYANKVAETVKDSSPEYYKAAVNFSTPYIKLGKDLFIVTRNLSIRLYNNVAAYVEKNGPIVREMVCVCLYTHTLFLKLFFSFLLKVI